MKKQTSRMQRPLLCLMAALLLTLLCSVPVLAAGKQVVNPNRDSNGTYSYTGTMPDYDTDVYHRITVPSDGLLAIGGASIYPYSGTTGSLSVVLCDRKMKNIDRAAYGNYVSTDIQNPDKSKLAYHAVRKGTYYIRVSGCKNYTIAAKFEKWKDYGKSSKSKAYNMKEKKYVKGAFHAGEKKKTTDWYKFKVKKNKKLFIDIETMGTGAIQCTIYGPDLPSRGLNQYIYPGESKRVKIVNARTKKPIKVSKGTYYIKVRRSTGYPKGSGIYSLYWRLK